ncbi:MAG TPA: hypothetical protein VLL77_09370 [Anaerolineales bacterium]|nr:hypothetical protein [Anaerolineales bacterium]
MPTDTSPEEIARSHRWHAVECNNLAWQLSDEPSRDFSQDQEMLNAAHASAFHWAKVGTELHQARAKMLLAHVHAALGMGPSALTYAQQSFKEISAHQPPDWEIAFLHAVLSHAAFAAGKDDLHQSHYRKARDYGEAIADPQDKEIFLKTFRRLPAP